jgi:Kringle domain
VYSSEFSVVSVLTGKETFDKQCMMDVSGLRYTGTMNKTLSGRACQMWSSQNPHVHPYDDVTYFPDNVDDLDAVVNYCRNPVLGAGEVPDVKPWCYTAYEDMEKEYCNINYCKGRKTNSIKVLHYTLFSRPDRGACFIVAASLFC